MTVLKEEDNAVLRDDKKEKEKKNTAKEVGEGGKEGRVWLLVTRSQEEENKKHTHTEEEEKRK